MTKEAAPRGAGLWALASLGFPYFIPVIKHSFQHPESSVFIQSRKKNINSKEKHVRISPVNRKIPDWKKLEVERIIILLPQKRKQGRKK